MDGTFKICPRPYQQVLEIFGELHGHVIPLVHVLIERRTIGHYRQVLQFIRRTTNHRWGPRSVVCDFESAMHAAVKTELQGTAITACYFHFCQNLWRKIQELGLSGPFCQNQRLKTYQKGNEVVCLSVYINYVCMCVLVYKDISFRL